MTVTDPDIDTTSFTGNLDEAANSVQALARAVDKLALGIADAPSDNIYYGRRNGAWTNLKTYFDTLYNLYIHPNHSGDVTSVGDGATTIVNDAVTNAKAANMAQATIKGRAAAAGTGDPTDLTSFQVTTILSADIANLIYPVGIVITLGVSTNPATLFGVGTWTAITGRVIVGKAAGGTFVTLNATGGEETHLLTSSEMPPHSHTQDAHNHTQNSHNHTQDAHNHTQDAHTHLMLARNNSVLGSEDKVAKPTAATGGQSNYTGSSTTATNQAATATNQATTATNIATVATNQATGGGGTHNNLQPYIVKYVWERTA